jgi:hypothetical protein
MDIMAGDGKRTLLPGVAFSMVNVFSFSLENSTFHTFSSTTNGLRY